VKKRITMTHPTGRVLAVLDLLQTHGQMSGEELATRLEVDARTIRRYVLLLRDQGMPIEMRRGRYGGYRLRPGFKLPLALTEPEALSILCGLLAMRQRQVGVATPNSEQALNKLMRALSPQTRDLMRELEAAVTFAFPTMMGGELDAMDHLKAIIRAVNERHTITMRYRSQTGEVSERKVDPYHVVYRYGRWYLIGYCHLRADQRVFRIDRILSVEGSSEGFETPLLDPLAVVEQALA